MRAQNLEYAQDVKNKKNRIYTACSFDVRNGIASPEHPPKDSSLTVGEKRRFLCPRHFFNPRLTKPSAANSTEREKDCEPYRCRKWHDLSCCLFCYMFSACFLFYFWFVPFFCLLSTCFVFGSVFLLLVCFCFPPRWQDLHAVRPGRSSHEQTQQS